MRTSHKTREQKFGTQMKSVTFEAPEQGLIEVKVENLEQENLFVESDTERSGFVDGQNQVYKFFPGSFDG